MLKKTLAFAFYLLFPLLVHGAIYEYVDERGVLHFTNILPVGRKCRVISQEGKTRTTSQSLAGDVSHPSAYDNLIALHANTHGLDPNLVKAIVKAESNYNPRALSPKGARGLMQIMPDTAKFMKIEDPFNPEENIKAGTGYLKFLAGVFQGNLELMLAAYNAGPNRVIEHKMQIPPIEETRNFVKKVKSYYDRLRSRNEG
jgi:soluble lytic murein transglycosylase-like protein